MGRNREKGSFEVRKLGRWEKGHGEKGSYEVMKLGSWEKENR